MHRHGREAFSEQARARLEACESRVDENVARLEAALIELRRHLHAWPEPSGEEVETSRFIAEKLRVAGLEPRICRHGLGVIADLDIGRPAPDCPRIALRCDMDALRVPDEKTVEYASRVPGVAHACGHDAHSAILLGAALAGLNISQASAETEPGLRLRFIFQPAEEVSAGAQWMVDQGALEGVDSILGLHVDPERTLGTVGIRYGVLTANCDEVEIEVSGHGGHAARPHHSVDPIAAAAHLIGTLYHFLPRSVDTRNPFVFTVGQINGGYAPNVIPERVQLRGSLRSLDAGAREVLKRRIEEICGGVQQNSGGQITVRFLRPLRAVVNHPRIAAALDEASRRVVGPAGTETIEHASMGGEDFSVYLDKCPGALLRLGCAVPGRKAPFLHSPVFDIDERALALGTRILLRAAFLLSESSREETKT